tara:strand:+ start:6395 stop:7402 length:1008 start_codon:yes stop_codon:yes gene_type:complete
MSLLNKSDKIFVAGSTGMVGLSICKLLQKNKYSISNKNLLVTNRNELDLTDANKVNLWFRKNKPNIVICAAAKVGGIFANNEKPVDFLLENLKIQNNLIESSFKYGVKRFLFLGSSCIYPKASKQPIKEEYLLNDYLENTNQWYAIAKISGLKLCEAFRKQYNFDAISLMPTNLYGPNDNYQLKGSHVMAALIRKFYEAKKNNLSKVTCWGTGMPLREFLYVEDFAEACLFSLRYWNPSDNNAPKDKNGNSLKWLNIGSNYEISIKELANKISKLVGFEGEILWDHSKPDGTFRKRLCSRNINKLGWSAKTNLDKGIHKTFKSFKNELSSNRIRI